MNNALKEAINTLYGFCDLPSPRDTSEKKISIEREQIKRELINFISYLSASDGIIADFEADFLKSYVGVYYSAEELRKYIDTNNTYSSQFEQTVPKTLKDFIDRDNRVYQDTV